LKASNIDSFHNIAGFQSNNMENKTAIFQESKTARKQDFMFSRFHF